MANGLIYTAISVLLAFTLHGYVQSRHFENRVRYFSANSQDPYLQQRTNVLNDERSLRIGSHITLNDKEVGANAILNNLKRQEISKSRVPFGKPFVPSLHFFEGKSLMENSEVFKIIQKMPKGK